MQRLGLGVLQCGWTGFASRIAAQPADRQLSRVVESAKSAVGAALRKDLIAIPPFPQSITYTQCQKSADVNAFCFETCFWLNDKREEHAIPSPSAFGILPPTPTSHGS